MAINSSVIGKMAIKLGLGEDPKVIRKATELERLLTLRLGQGNNVNCTAKAFICLDLATSLCGTAFDMMYAVNLSGLKKPVYLKTRLMAEKLLNLNKTLTVKGFCVMNDCVEASETAEKILNKYKEHDAKDTDISHSQYVTMAIFQSCRLHKIKVAKAKYLSACNLKPSLWSRLEEEWTIFVDKHFSDLKKNTTKKISQSVNKNSLKDIDEDIDQRRHNKTEDNKEIIEDYDAWKARILEQAYKELNERISQDVTMARLKIAC